MYAWKRLSDGSISQQTSAATPEDLFLAAGFGPVRVDEPVKGFLAVEVERRNGMLVEVPPVPRPG